VLDTQKLALSATGANAMGLGSMGMSVPGMLAGLGGGMIPSMLSGMGAAPFMEVPTKVVCLSQVGS
jgi:hypothetical protein